MEVHRNIPYAVDTSRNRLHEFDLYVPSSGTRRSTPRPLICFVHGGAWRSEDKADHAVLAERLTLQTGIPVAVPNYRLTPSENTKGIVLRHPSHAEDILQFLEFLLAWKGPLGYSHVFDSKQLFLMGHSCAAHMLLSILLDSSAVTPSLTPSEALLDAVKGIIVSEGIYDLDLLKDHFPDYLDWFIRPAFGNMDSYASFAVTSYPLRKRGPCWLVIHSQGDMLIDPPQSEKMWLHLKSQYGPAADKQIFFDASLTQGHDDILITDDFVGIVQRFVSAVLAPIET